MEEEKKEVAEKPIIVEKPKRPNLWKLLTLLLAVLILLGGTYYLGTQRGENVALAPSPRPAASGTPTASPSSVTTSPTTKTPSKSVEAGGNIGVFMPYRIQVPTDWVDKHESTGDVLDVLEISKGGYKIRIQQAGGEGSICNYGAPSNEPFTQNYSTFVEFQSLDEDFRRSGETGGTGWTICHKTKEGWGFPTLYGYISYSNPSNPNLTILKEMDSILATIAKQ